ncbi:MAG: M28 family peptidase [Candidatus Latescibacterota bacterium]|nr:MAG: M28 family peptidase [Candidatus Latescibacterota bacterium]
MTIPSGIGRWLTGLTMAVLVSCTPTNQDSRTAENCINADSLERHVLALASDAFEGRKPFTRGEQKTVAYLATQFETMGFEGANNGSFFQDVPLVEISGTPSSVMMVAAPRETVELGYLDEFIASTSRITGQIDIDGSELVFAGYGIVAPEFGWNDYDGLNVKGKTVMVLVNDPGFATQNPQLFKGNAMTYYGRWTYKYEEAARQGAEGVIVIHETKAAGYPWTVLQNGASGADLLLQADDGHMSRCALEGWLTTDAAAKILAACGLDSERLFESAAAPGFEPVITGARVTVSITNELRFDTSKNVVAMLRGAGRADECVVFTAHWDHLGIGPVADGDSIYNGAADNALPLACMLETARAFSGLDRRPSRTVLFIAVTAEETGLLGSAYYAANPIFPLEKTVANLNYELFLPIGRMADVTVFGWGQSELDSYVVEAAKAQSRYVTPEPFPENGMYFRSDHFSFAKAGVPALFVKGWSEDRERGSQWTSGKIAEFWSKHYHRPSDEYDPHTSDLGGIVEDAKLFFKIGYALSTESTFPRWNANSEFKAVRDSMMAEHAPVAPAKD